MYEYKRTETEGNENALSEIQFSEPHVVENNELSYSSSKEESKYPSPKKVN